MSNELKVSQMESITELADEDYIMIIQNGTNKKALISDFNIPSNLSELTEDSTHRTVSDTEKTTWNGKGTYSKPTGRNT